MKESIKTHLLNYKKELFHTSDVWDYVNARDIETLPLNDDTKVLLMNVMHNVLDDFELYVIQAENLKQERENQIAL